MCVAMEAKPFLSKATFFFLFNSKSMACMTWQKGGALVGSFSGSSGGAPFHGAVITHDFWPAGTVILPSLSEETRPTIVCGVAYDGMKRQAG